MIITVPYTIGNTIAGLVGISPSLTEAALSLGAKECAAFWEITFPLARTGIIAGTIFAFAFSMDDVQRHFTLRLDWDPGELWSKVVYG